MRLFILSLPVRISSFSSPPRRRKAPMRSPMPPTAPATRAPGAASCPGSPEAGKTSIQGAGLDQCKTFVGSCVEEGEWPFHGNAVEITGADALAAPMPPPYPRVGCHACSRSTTIRPAPQGTRQGIGITLSPSPGFPAHQHHGSRQDPNQHLSVALVTALVSTGMGSGKMENPMGERG